MTWNTKGLRAKELFLDAFEKHKAEIQQYARDHGISRIPELQPIYVHAALPQFAEMYTDFFFGRIYISTSFLNNPSTSAEYVAVLIAHEYGHNLHGHWVAGALEPANEAEAMAFQEIVSGTIYDNPDPPFE